MDFQRFTSKAKYFPEKYKELEEEKVREIKKIEDPYNGEWISKTFNIPPGPKIGRIKKEIQNIKSRTKNVSEKEIISHIKEFLKEK